MMLSTNSSHSIWISMGYTIKKPGKCYVWGGKKKGYVGARKVGNSCNKLNTCTLYHEKINK